MPANDRSGNRHVVDDNCILSKKATEFSLWLVGKDLIIVIVRT